MNCGPKEAREFVRGILGALTTIGGVEKVLCPPSISIPAVQTLVADMQITVGAQNMYFEEQGAFTGEISPLMLQGLCEYVILGHSERRAYFRETHELVNRKT